MCMAAVCRPQTLDAYNAGTEHVGFPPTRQALIAPSAKNCEEW